MLTVSFRSQVLRAGSKVVSKALLCRIYFRKAFIVPRRVCCYSMIIKMYKYCVDSSICHLKFFKVVLAHIIDKWALLHSFVKCLFQDMPTNFYWNRFIFDQLRAKISWQSFLRHVVCFVANLWPFSQWKNIKDRLSFGQVKPSAFLEHNVDYPVTSVITVYPRRIWTK